MLSKMISKAAKAALHCIGCIGRMINPIASAGPRYSAVGDFDDRGLHKRASSNSLRKILTIATLAMMAGQTALPANQPSPVIEVVTLKLKSDVSAEQFGPVDREVQTTYMVARPGFLSRESAPGSDNTWVVIVHWRSVADADSSMKSFETAPAAAKFMSMIVANSMVMTRYHW
jgi:hypothetical protein